MTYESDYSGVRWFYPFEQLSGGISQEATSRNRGIKIEDFAFLYFTASGTLVTTQERIRRKLLDVPGILLLVIRIHYISNGEKELSPADVNIITAPF
jgi:hypothetical protein